MSTYSGSNSNFTPSVSADNYVLDGNGTGAVGIIESIGWGASLNTATSYRTTWARPTANASSTFSALGAQSGNPGGTPACRLGTFATQATIPGEPGGLYTVAWNGFGGIGFITMPINGAWVVANSGTAGVQQICCRNRAGTDASASTYSMSWRE